VRSSGIITLSAQRPSDSLDEARLRRGHNDQSRWGHQRSKTTLTGESLFHISTPLGIKPGSLMTGSKRVDHWTSGTVYECSEIVGSPHATVAANHAYLHSTDPKLFVFGKCILLRGILALE
jgi:hypothetical protein